MLENDRVNKSVRIVRHETGAGNIAARHVDLDAVAIENVLGYSLKVIIVGVVAKINSDDPFEPIARRAAK